MVEHRDAFIAAGAVVALVTCCVVVWLRTRAHRRSGRLGLGPDDETRAEKSPAGSSQPQPDTRGPILFRFLITHAKALGPGDHFARRILLEGTNLEGEIRELDRITIPAKTGEDYLGTVLGIARYNHVLPSLRADGDPTPFHVTAWPRDMDPNNIRHDIAVGQRVDSSRSMSAGRIQVFWNGTLIGVVCDPFWEMFNVSGKWSPAAGERYEQFLAVLRNGGEVPVSLDEGHVTGTIDALPDADGEVAIRYDAWHR